MLPRSSALLSNDVATWAQVDENIGKLVTPSNDRSKKGGTATGDAAGEVSSACWAPTMTPVFESRSFAPLSRIRHHISTLR